MKSNAQKHFFKEGKIHEGKENRQYCNSNYCYGLFNRVWKILFRRILVGYASCI